MSIINPEIENELLNIAVQTILQANREKNPALLQAGADLFASLQPDGNEILGEQMAGAMREVMAKIEQAHNEIQARQNAALERAAQRENSKLTDEERKAKAQQLIKNQLNASLAGTLCAEASKLQSMLETGAVPPGILTRLGLAEGRQSFTAEEQTVMRARIDELKAKAAELLAEMDDPALQAGHAFLAC